MLDIKQELRTLKIDTIATFINALTALQNIELPTTLLATFSRAFLLKYHQRIMAESPSEIRAHPEKSRYAMLAIFAYIQKQSILDRLAQSLWESLNALKIKSETYVKRTIIENVACVKGKFDILYNLAQLSVDTPQGIIADTIYPNVSKETLNELAEELKHRGHWYIMTPTF